jgi:septal ring factor EnvC (AmiA/AmiB activator)
MHAAATAPDQTRVTLFRRRESATEKMIRQIDEKISRLGAARRDRAAALQKIRSELARALTAGPAAPDCHERPN